jgi:hypothetical protein
MKPNPLDPLFAAQLAPRDAKRLEAMDAEWTRYSELSDKAYELGMVKEGDMLAEAADAAADQLFYALDAIEEGEESDAPEGDLEGTLIEAYEDHRTGGHSRGLHSKAELAEHLRWAFSEFGVDAKDASDEQLIEAAYDAWLWKTKLRRRLEPSSR